MMSDICFYLWSLRLQHIVDCCSNSHERNNLGIYVWPSVSDHSRYALNMLMDEIWKDKFDESVEQHYGHA